MRFVANTLNYKHQIQAGRVRKHLVGNDDVHEEVLEPHLVAEFKDLYPLTFAERAAARAHFDGVVGAQEGAYGPAYRFNGIFASGDPDLDGLSYNGVNDAFRMSVFDTETMLDADQEPYRDAFERVLSSSSDLGHTFIRIDNVVLEKPFEAYATMSAAQVAAACLLTGKNARVVLAYEQATENREEYVAALEAVIADGASAELVDSALAGMDADRGLVLASAGPPKRRGRQPQTLEGDE